MRCRALPLKQFIALCLLPFTLCACWAEPTSAVVTPSTPTKTADELTAPVTLEAALRALFNQADVIFTGEVVEITRTATGVEVEWRVEDAVRGVFAGQMYTLREWQGLWQSNSDRYAKGQRALLLLHAPSAAGYASPVGGADGVITLHGDSGLGTLDLRLLQQRVLVTDAARLRPAQALQAAGGSLPVSDELQRTSAAQNTTRPVQTAQTVRHALQAASLSVPFGKVVLAASAFQTPVASEVTATSNNIDTDVVLGLLQSWQKQRGAGQ